MTFGDFDPDDALDHEPPDPEAVAAHLHELRAAYGLEDVGWDDLDERHRLLLVSIVAALLHALHDEGAEP